VGNNLKYEIDKGSRGCLSIRDSSIHLKLCSLNILYNLHEDFVKQCELNSCTVPRM